MGNVLSLVFIFKVTQLILSHSVLFDPLIGIVYEEAANLAAYHPRAFNFFTSASNFYSEAYINKCVVYFLKAQNIDALVAVGKEHLASSWKVGKGTVFGQEL